MQIFGCLKPDGRNSISLAILLALICIFGVDRAAFAAIVLDGGMLDNGKGNAQLAEPNGVDSDALGNVYVADHGTSRIIKFNQHGQATGVIGAIVTVPSIMSEGAITSGSASALRLARREVGGETFDARHGSDRLAPVSSGDHENRPDQVVHRQRCLAHQPPRLVVESKEGASFANLLA